MKDLNQKKITSLSELFSIALIRRHLKRLDAISDGIDVRAQLAGCRATRFNRSRRMAKSLEKTLNVKQQTNFMKNEIQKSDSRFDYLKNSNINASMVMPKIINSVSDAMKESK